MRDERSIPWLRVRMKFEDYSAFSTVKI